MRYIEYEVKDTSSGETLNESIDNLIDDLKELRIELLQPTRRGTKVDIDMIR